MNEIGTIVIGFNFSFYPTIKYLLNYKCNQTQSTFKYSLVLIIQAW